MSFIAYFQFRPLIICEKTVLYSRCFKFRTPLKNRIKSPFPGNTEFEAAVRLLEGLAWGV